MHFGHAIMAQTSCLLSADQIVSHGRGQYLASTCLEHCSALLTEQHWRYERCFPALGGQLYLPRWIRIDNSQLVALRLLCLGSLR